MKKFFALFALLVTAAFAQEQNVVISPQSIVVNPLPEFTVDVSVDKDASGNSIPTYQIGERITVNVRTSADAYVYLYNIRSTGEIVQFMPNNLTNDNYVRAGQTKTFPPAGARYQLSVDGPTGIDKVIAVASKQPLDVSQLASISRDANFATSNAGQESFAQTLSIVVRPLPQTDWVTDTVLFNVGGAPAPQIGIMNISSNPGGAAVYIDGQFRGYTPLSVRERAGSHTVRIDQAGYQSFQQSISVVSGRAVNVNANLSGSAPVQNNGTATFFSEPAGAQVYVNDRYVGSTPTGNLTFPNGTYVARFVLPNNAEQSVSFSVSGNRNTRVSARLVTVPQQGNVLVRTNVNNARVFINGTDYGVTNGGSGRISDLPSGRHQLTVVAPGYSTFVSEFTVSGGGTTDLNVTLSRR